MKSIADNVFGLRVMLADNGMAYEIGTYKEPQTDTINNTQTDCAIVALKLHFFWFVDASFYFLCHCRAIQCSYNVLLL